MPGRNHLRHLTGSCCPATTVGGTFGSAGINGQGGFTVGTESDPDVHLLHLSNRIPGASGSPSTNTIRGGVAAMWEFASPLTLDGTRVLESLTFSVQTSGVNRNNTAYFLAATAATPEPSAAALLFPLAMLVRPRRRAAAQ